MNKKQKRNLLLLLAAVVLCGGLYLGLRWYNDRPQSPAEETAALAGEMGEIVSLRYSNAEGELSFQKKDGVWRWEGDADYPLDTSKVESTAQVIASLTPMRTLDVQQMDSLEAYGLAEPSCTAQITDENGKTFSLSLGGSVSSSYYLQRQGDSTVYVVGSTLSSHLEETIEDLFLLDSIPSLTEHNLRSLCISGRVTVNLTPTATEQTDDSGNETTVVTWDCQGTDVTENQRIKDLLSQLKSLSFTGSLDYSGSSDATQRYGLDAPLLIITAVYQDEDAQPITLTLTVGRQQEDGSYAVRMGDSHQINRLSADALESALLLAEHGLES